MKLGEGIRRFFGFGGHDLDEDLDLSAPAAPAGGYIVGEGLTLKGEITGEGDVRLLGRFEGTVAISGAVFIGQNGEVDGDLSATSIVVAGRVRGNLSATGRVEILPQGMLTGNLKSGSFNAADGAVVKGELWVERSAPRLSAAPLASRV